MPILPTERDPRLITVRRGGTLTGDDHRLLAEWALQCSEHVLHLFEDLAPGDTRPRDSIDVGRAWIRGDVPMKVAHQSAFRANAAGKGLPDPARFAALSAGQAVAVAHVAAHDLGAAAYAIRAAEQAWPLRRGRRRDCRNGSGSAPGSRTRSASSSSTTSDVAARSAGTSSTTDLSQRARR